MFYGQCWGCGQRWELGTASTCVCPELRPEQEPVATVVSESGNQEVTMSWWHEPALPVGTKLYITPPQRKPLTDEEADEFVRRFARYELIRAIEAAHDIKE